MAAGVFRFGGAGGRVFGLLAGFPLALPSPPYGGEGSNRNEVAYARILLPTIGGRGGRLVGWRVGHLTAPPINKTPQSIRFTRLSILASGKPQVGK
jgi:hypothetical protein